jgi:GT2 family glycosyltransferase
MKHPYIGSVAPTIMRLEPDHSFVKIDSMGIMVPKNGLGRDITRVEDLPNIIAACGACMLYRRETLEDIKVNGEYFDEDFFAYCEDTDLGMRSMLRGWAINSSKCYINHVHSASMKSAPGYIQLLGHRNNILTVIKNYPKKTLIKHLPSIIFWQFASIGVWFARMKPFLILKLKYDAIKLIPKMLQKRKIIQSRSKVDDFEEYLS